MFWVLKLTKHMQVKISGENYFGKHTKIIVSHVPAFKVVLKLHLGV